MTEEKYWKIVDKIGWGRNSVDYRKLGEELLQHIQEIEDVEHIRKWTKHFRSELDKILYDSKHNMIVDEKYRFWGGDDSYWDFTAHIVGMGKEYYDSVFDDIHNLFQVGSNFHENFEYLFRYAEKYAETEEGKKILNVKKREQKLERILDGDRNNIRLV